MKSRIRNKYYFNSKSKYLRNLSKRKEQGIRLLEEEKASLIVDKLLRNNMFIRDYSVFIHKSPVSKPILPPIKLHFTPDIKLFINSPMEKDFPEKYKKKNFDSDSFAQIYKSSRLTYTQEPKNRYTSKFPLKKTNLSCTGICSMKITNLKFGNNYNNSSISTIQLPKHGHLMTSGTYTDVENTVQTKSSFRINK